MVLLYNSDPFQKGPIFQNSPLGDRDLFSKKKMSKIAPFLQKESCYLLKISVHQNSINCSGSWVELNWDPQTAPQGVPCWLSFFLSQ